MPGLQRRVQRDRVSRIGLPPSPTHLPAAPDSGLATRGHPGTPARPSSGTGRRRPSRPDPSTVDFSGWGIVRSPLIPERHPEMAPSREGLGRNHPATAGRTTMTVVNDLRAHFHDHDHEPASLFVRGADQNRAEHFCYLVAGRDGPCTRAASLRASANSVAPAGWRRMRPCASSVSTSAPVIARALGIHGKTTTRIASDASGPRSSYAPDYNSP